MTWWLWLLLLVPALAVGVIVYWVIVRKTAKEIQDEDHWS